MNCIVFSKRNSQVRITQQEVDVCAWDNLNMIGEAYECKVNPQGLEPDDCENLLDIIKECESYKKWFRIGVVSFDSVNKVELQLWNMGFFDEIEAFGYNTLHLLK